MNLLESTNNWYSKLTENLLLEHSEKQIQEFNNKFGEGSYNKLFGSIERLKRAGCSTDISVYLSKRFTVQDYEDLVERIYGNLDVDGKPIPEPKHTKEQLLINEVDGDKLYKVDCFEDMIMMSEGTGDGSVGGRCTGWCVGGRYGVPFGKVAISQIKYFDQYKINFNFDTYLVLITRDDDMFCILFNTQAKSLFDSIVDIADKDDNDHIKHNSSQYILDFIEKYEQLLSVVTKDNPYKFYINGDTLTDYSGRIEINPYNINFNPKILDSIKTIEIKDNFGIIDLLTMCKNLKKIIMLEGITNIPKEAFWRCESVESIIIPNSVTTIGEGAFFGCKSLQSINIPENVTSIGEDAFYGCKSLKNINIPNGVTEIKSCTFFGCESLQSINIPENVTKIEKAAFKKCESLQSINIPKSVRKIAHHVFCLCNSLQSITIPNNTSWIGKWAFGDCTSLQSINIPFSVKIIEDRAFYNCSNLKEVSILNSRVKIGDQAFKYCPITHLTASQDIKQIVLNQTNED